MTTAIIYARVSSVKQAEKEIPIESQLDSARQKAVEMGVTVLKEFVDGGKSGRHLAGRHAFMAAIEYCELMEAKFFIVWDTKRFARNKVDAAVLKHRLRKAGVKLIYVSQNIDVSTDDGWFMEGLLEILDEKQSRDTGRDTKRSQMKNARDGFFNGGAVPFGYQAVNEGKRRRLQIDEAEASIARRIFAEYLNGAGLKSITLGLNQAGLYRRGQKWSKNTVAYLLKNWIYVGFITFNRYDRAERIEREESLWIRTKSHPAIISEEDFMRVQKRLSSRAPALDSGSPHSQHKFTGLLRCGACGMGMQIESASGRRATYTYYNCGNALRGTGCKSRRIRTSLIEGDLLQFLVERLVNREEIEKISREIAELQGNWAKDRAARRELLVRDMRDVERRRAKLFELLELHGKSAPNLGDMTDRLQSHNARLRAIEGELSALEESSPPEVNASPAEIGEVIAFMRETITGCENPKKIRDFLGSFIDRIVVEGEHAVIHYNPAKLVNARPVAVVHSSRKWLLDLDSNQGPAD